MCPTLVNLVEDHEFISGEYYLVWESLFGVSPTRVYAQSGQYHTIAESRVS